MLSFIYTFCLQIFPLSLCQTYLLTDRQLFWTRAASVSDQSKVQDGKQPSNVM